MLTIVTGPVNAGKTARMRKLSLQAPAADGLLSEKIFRDGAFGGYRLVRLQGGEGMDLALPVSAFNGQFTEACRLGPFVFSAEAFRYGLRTLALLREAPAVQTIFLDEAGPLELRGEGFAAALPPLLQSGKALCIAVRSPCLRAFLRTFGVTEYRAVFV